MQAGCDASLPVAARLWQRACGNAPVATRLRAPLPVGASLPPAPPPS